MKRNILLIMFCFMAVVGFGQDKKLTILHTNDTHSQIYPLSPNLADTMKADRGGFVRRIAMLKEERAKNQACYSLIVATSRKARLITQCLRVMLKWD